MATNHHNCYFASGILQNILKVCRPGSLHFVAYPGKNRADFPVLEQSWFCHCWQGLWSSALFLHWVRMELWIMGLWIYIWHSRTILVNDWQLLIYWLAVADDYCCTNKMFFNLIKKYQGKQKQQPNLASAVKAFVTWKTKTKKRRKRKCFLKCMVTHFSHNPYKVCMTGLLGESSEGFCSELEALPFSSQTFCLHDHHEVRCWLMKCMMMNAICFRSLILAYWCLGLLCSDNNYALNCHHHRFPPPLESSVPWLTLLYISVSCCTRLHISQSCQILTHKCLKLKTST